MQSSNATDDDLLALARKAWPRGLPEECGTSLSGTLYIDDGHGCGLMLIASHPRAREAMLAALSILAGDV